jgi:hypothetical protein
LQQTVRRLPRISISLHVTTTIRCAWAALSAAIACSSPSEPPAGVSCDAIAELGVCVDDQEAAGCAAAGGQPRTARCPSTDRVGSCAVAGGRTRHAYAGRFDSHAARLECVEIHRGVYAEARP